MESSSFPNLLTSFGEALASRERSRATVEKYLRDLRAFFLWLDGREPSRTAAAEWKEFLLEKGYKPVTINSMLSALNGFFRFLGREDCRVSFLRVQRRLFRDPGRELGRRDYEQLVRAAKSSGQHRLSLLMQTICATGIRVSELRYITVEAAKAGRADISLKGKIRTILLPRQLCLRLLNYARRQKTASGEIFLTGNSQSLSRRQIWREMKRLCGRAGVAAGKVFPHNLRHLFAVSFYRACRDIVKLADVLGHTSIDTTRLYLVSTGTEHARQLGQLHLLL